ncbi:MAG: hypothetical protein WKF84_09100 [Pyrinomonadaceae bacterium]
MPTIQIDTERLLNAALQMPHEELEQFVARLFALKARQETPGLSQREAELLLKINQGLPPDMQQRLNELIDKRQVIHDHPGRTARVNSAHRPCRNVRC